MKPGFIAALVLGILVVLGGIAVLVYIFAGVRVPIADSSEVTDTADTVVLVDLVGVDGTAIPDKYAYVGVYGQVAVDEVGEFATESGAYDILQAWSRYMLPKSTDTPYMLLVRNRTTLARAWVATTGQLVPYLMTPSLPEGDVPGLWTYTGVWKNVETPNTIDVVSTVQTMDTWSASLAANLPAELTLSVNDDDDWAGVYSAVGRGVGADWSWVDTRLVYLVEAWKLANHERYLVLYYDAVSIPRFVFVNDGVRSVWAMGSVTSGDVADYTHAWNSRSTGTGENVLVGVS